MGEARPLDEELQQAANTPLPDDEEEEAEDAAAQQVWKLQHAFTHASACSAPAMHGFPCTPVAAVEPSALVHGCAI